MKAPKLLLAALAVSFSISAFSQQDAQQKTQTDKKETKVSTWGIYPPPAPTVDSAAAALEAQSRANMQTFPAPNFGSYYIPVLGNYSAAESNTDKQIVITADEKNIGKVWIEGLAPVKVYALLKAAPGTYKIPAQKNAQEGTLIYDESNKQVNICLGCGYKDNNPTAVLENKQSTAKSKKTRSVLNFTGVKTDQGTVSTQ
jgi:hypothetical protein